MSFSSSVFVALCISYSGYAAGLLSNVIISRLLGVHGKGAFSLFIETTFAIIMFSSLGIGNGQIYESSKNPDTLKHFIPNSYIFSIIFGGGIAAIYYLAGLLFQFKVITVLTPSLIAVGIFAVPIMTMATFQRQYLLTTHSYRLAKTNGALGVVLPLGIYCLLYVLDIISVSSLIFAFVLGQLICFFMFHVYISRNAPENQSLSFSFAKKSAKFGLLQYLGDLCSYLTRRLDFFLVFWFLGQSGLGIYSVAVALAEITSRLSHEIGTILFPVFASDKASSKKAAAILRMTVLSVVVIALILEAASGPIVILLFGKQFAESIVCFQILLLGTIALATIDVTWNHAMANGRPGLGIPIFGLAALVDALLNVVLIPRMGLVGASISASISYWLAASILIGLFCRKEHCSVSEALFVRSDDIKILVRAVKGLPGILLNRTGEIR